MGRLVGDLLDFSAIDSGVLRLVPDWCDLGLVLDAARACVTEAPPGLIVVDDCTALPPIWADHDRLEQVFVNLFENAVRHAVGVTRVIVTASLEPGDGRSACACPTTGRASDRVAPNGSSWPTSAGRHRVRGPGWAWPSPAASSGPTPAASASNRPTTGATVLVELPLEPDDAFDRTDMSDPVDVGSAGRDPS